MVSRIKCRLGIIEERAAAQGDSISHLCPNTDWLGEVIGLGRMRVRAFFLKKKAMLVTEDHDTN